VKSFEYIVPSSLSEACALKEAHRKDARFLAGGTDLLVQMKREIVQPSLIVDLKRIRELYGIRSYGEDGLEIGSLVTVNELDTSAEVKARFPALSDAAGMIGSPQIRNRATIGGNLCRAAPSGDLAPILMVLGSRVILTGPTVEREMILEDFFAGPGVTKLRPGELMAMVKVPGPVGCWGAAYERFSYRKTLDLSLVGVAVFLKVRREDDVCESARIALASVGPVPFRSKDAEKALEGFAVTDKRLAEASEAACREAKPITDVYGEAWYKRRLVGVLVESAAKKALEMSRRVGDES
jgi:CO/xanthine dehydrogenase FAD-binding subunit